MMYVIFVMYLLGYIWALFTAFGNLKIKDWYVIWTLAVLLLAYPLWLVLFCYETIRWDILRKL